MTAYPGIAEATHIYQDHFLILGLPDIFESHENIVFEVDQLMPSLDSLKHHACETPIASENLYLGCRHSTLATFVTVCRAFHYFAP